MKRAWLALLEVGLSILFLTTFFIYIQSNLINTMNTGYFDPDLYRNLTPNCSAHPSLVYYFNNSTVSVFCEHGKRVSNIKGYSVIGQYLYAGYKKYSPKVIVIYR
jgi:hypothetical protein